MLVVSNRNIISSIVIQNWIQKNSSWQYVCLPRYEKNNRMSQRTKEFPTKNSGDNNNQCNEITGQTDLN